MTLQPLLDASPAIQLHVVVAVAAFVIGGFVLFRRKGDRPHRRLGRVWVALMALVALSSFFIWEIRMVGPFSPIHLLSLATLFGLWQAVRHARRREIVRHRRLMQGLYVGALAITGLLTFTPGRIMHEVAFGGDGASAGEIVAFLAAVTAIAAGGAWLSRRRPRPRRTAVQAA